MDISAHQTGKSLCNSAVRIKNLFKGYNNEPFVLRDVCMTIKKGSIYGLLGSSGCGKTSLLACIVGLQKWNSGELFVFGKKPGTKHSGIPGKGLGYMPQTTALQNYLSSLEIAEFYGKIYDMDVETTHKQWANLKTLLMLPNDSRLIKDLSGGQQKRVSLALALIHSPKLLVLDEPTVGLDPLLRQSIWEHLYNTVKISGTTILLTSHYVEEMQCADQVGVMRFGRMLVEGPPLELLRQYQCELLQQVVLELCRNDSKNCQSFRRLNPTSSAALGLNQSSMNDNDSRSVKQLPVNNMLAFDDHVELRNKLLSEESFLKSLWHCLQRSIGLATMLLRTMFRHKGFFLMLLWMPCIQGSLSLIAFAYKPTQMNFGIVNHELYNWTSECELLAQTRNACDFESVSCSYLDLLKRNNTFVLSPFVNEVEALTNVHMGEIWGYLVFSQNFSENSRDLMLLRQFSTNKTLEGSVIRVYLDYSKFIEAFYMVKYLFEFYLECLKKIATECRLAEKEVRIPLRFRNPVYGSTDGDFTAFVVPGLTVCTLMATISVLTALLLIAERKQGTLMRTRSAGLHVADIICGVLITQLLVTLGQVIIWISVLHIVFGFTFVGSVFLFTAVCVLTGLCGASIDATYWLIEDPRTSQSIASIMSLQSTPITYITLLLSRRRVRLNFLVVVSKHGLFVGLTSKDEKEALIFGVFMFAFFVTVGGVLYPREYMSHIWRRLGTFLPNSLPTITIRSIVVRGWGLTHSSVWPGICALVAWTVALCACSAIMLMNKIT